MAGRKSLKEEIKIVDRLTALSQPTFDYIDGLYKAGDKEDKKWAVEQMMKLYSKCVPQPGEDEDSPIFNKVTINYNVPNGGTVPQSNPDTQAAPSQPSPEQPVS